MDGSTRPDVVEVFEEGQRIDKTALGSEGVGKRPVACVGSADSTDVYVIQGACCQTADGERVVGDAGDTGTRAEGKACRTILKLVRAGGSGVPADTCGMQTHVACSDIVYTRARRYVFDHEFVEIGVAIYSVGRHDGDVLAVAVVVVERYFERLPNAETCRDGRADLDESCHVFGIGHDTHLQLVRVAGVGSIEPEADLQRVDRRIERRQHHVGPCATGGVHVHGTSARHAVAGRGVGVAR